LRTTLGRSACLDLDQRHVGALVGADHLGLELALVGELHGDFVGPSTTWALVRM
jgi:hypothetical protein